MNTPRNRQTLILLMLTLPVIIGAPNLTAIEGEETRPNFVIIMVDDMGSEGVSCCGNLFFKTPEIDRLSPDAVDCSWRDGI